jgi:hypothetical protein
MKRPHYVLGPCIGRHHAQCFVMMAGEERPAFAVFGQGQREAQTRAQRLVDRLNDPGLPVYVIEVPLDRDAADSAGVRPWHGGAVIPIRGHRA